MQRVGQPRSIYFRLADLNNTPVLGATLTSLAVTLVRDSAPANDPLSLIDKGDGSYLLEYAPSAPGQDTLTITDAANGLVYTDIETIFNDDGFYGLPGTRTLTQDYGGTDALRLSYPSLSGYTLYAFLSRVWIAGNQKTSHAAASTRLDGSGKWSLTVLPGTYHLVLANAQGNLQLFKMNLAVS